MWVLGIWLSLVVDAPPNSGAEPVHQANVVYRALLEQGITLDGKRIEFPGPLFGGGQPAAAEHEALRKLAGSERGVADLLRDSVSAPFILKLKDEETPTSVIRRADLWFAVRGDLDAIDADATARRASSTKPVEAGNMKFTSRMLEPAELMAHKILLPKAEGPTQTWFVSQTGRLLDRIHVQSTSRVELSRDPDSLLIASRAPGDPRFESAPGLANRWWPIVRKGSREEAGAPLPFGGGASYVKVSRLASDPKVLLTEAHFAFAEPRGWFDGAPILRSKLSLIAQDQIRQLRRELAQRAGGAKPKGAKP